MLRVALFAALLSASLVSAVESECNACRAVFASSESNCETTCNATWPVNDNDPDFGSCYDFCERVKLMKEIFDFLKTNISTLEPAERDGVLASMKINGGDPCITIGYCPLPAQAPPKPAAASSYRPFVIMHGHASSASSMDTIVSWVTQDLPGITVRNIEIGDGTLSAIFMALNKQVANFAGQLAADPALQNGFNMLGYSQGALVTRGFIERFNYPQTYNWISLAGPDAGQFGLGNIPGWLWSFLNPLLRRVPYCFLVQHTFAFAQYWKNPYNLNAYVKHSAFLADINNDKPAKNATYKANFVKVNQAVLMFSDADDVIRPTQSGSFEFYAAGQDKTVVPLKSSDFYLQDFIGIKALDDASRLQVYETDCLHNEHHTEPCKDFFYQYGIPYLNN